MGDTSDANSGAAVNARVHIGAGGNPVSQRFNLLRREDDGE